MFNCVKWGKSIGESNDHETDWLKYAKNTLWRTCNSYMREWLWQPQWSHFLSNVGFLRCFYIEMDEGGVMGKRCVFRMILRRTSFIFCIFPLSPSLFLFLHHFSWTFQFFLSMTSWNTFNLFPKWIICLTSPSSFNYRAAFPRVLIEMM